MESSECPGITIFDESESKSRRFDQDYNLGRELRTGSYGTVFTTRHKNTNEEYAVKIIDRTKLKLKDDMNTLREISIMKDLSDLPNIVKLVDVYEDPETFYMVQVFAEGGDVFDRLAKRTAYTEGDARQLSKTLLETLNCMHKRKICHRDLKPENLLLKGRWDDAAILLADFGFAKYIPEEGLKTRCGTPAFVAPEIIKGQHYSSQVDMWSCGCLIYMIIGGYPPFQDESHRGLFRKIRAADFTFHKKYWSNVSVEAKELISGMMTVNPKTRLTCQQALEKAWITVDETQLSSRDLSGSISEIKSFQAKRKLKSTMTAVFWSVFKHDKISDMLNAMDKKDESSGSVHMSSDEEKPQEFRMSMMHKKNFEATYELGKKIHAGSFAIVHECFHRRWQISYAVKIITRDGKPQTDEAVLHEVAIMNKLDHPNIVKVVDFFEEDDKYYVVMELLAGGDVFDRIIDMKSYTENDARGLAKLLIETVGYIHSTGHAHRDIKPQNLLLVPSYVAPEILKSEPYDQQCDMWSCGVVLYSLLCGYTPFADDNQEKMFERIKIGDFRFDPKDWGGISQGAKDLISGLLVVNPDERLSAGKALQSTWITQDQAVLSDRDLSGTVEQIKKRRPRLRDLARAFISVGIGMKMPAIRSRENSRTSRENSRANSRTSRENSRANSEEDSAIKVV
eukprot:scaffold5159_cov112-Cylindrotheca_fusiformis.AAC.2